MAMTVEWDNEDKTILRAETRGMWTWDDYHEHLSRTFDMVKKLDHTVHLINVRHPDSIQPAGNMIPHITRAFRSMPDNMGITVMVGMSTFTVSMSKLFRKLFPQTRFVLADSVEDARLIIAEYDEVKE